MLIYLKFIKGKRVLISGMSTSRVNHLRTLIASILVLIIFEAERVGRPVAIGSITGLFLYSLAVYDFGLKIDFDFNFILVFV